MTLCTVEDVLLMPMKTGVYAIKNKVNGKVYVGSSTGSICKRWNMHRHHLRKRSHCNQHLQASWVKYGEFSFDFVVLEECVPSRCLDREQAWIDSLRSADDRFGYNINPRAESRFGAKHRISTREKLADLAKKQSMSMTEQERKERSRLAAQARWQGYKKKVRTKLPPEVARANRVRALTDPEMIAKRNAKTRSAEVRAKMSEAHKGKPLSEKHRAALLTMLRSPEARKRNSETKKAQWAKLNPEQRREKTRKAREARMQRRAETC